MNFSLRSSLRTLCLQTLACVLLFNHAVAASSDSSDDSADYVSYDSIVEDLQKQTAKLPSAATSKTSARRMNWFTSSSQGGDPFENVWIHAGVGFAQTTQTLTLPNGTETTIAGRGVQAALGIDILGPNLAAEGAMRTFGESEDAKNKVTLKEFDLKILFKSRTPRLGFRAGGGLSARYMTVHTLTESFDVTTPASVLTLGGDVYLTSRVSLGIDFSTRNAMISETFDRSSVDGTVRLDTHF